MGRQVTNNEILRILASTLRLAARRNLVVLVPVDDDDIYEITSAELAGGKIIAYFGLADQEQGPDILDAEVVIEQATEPEPTMAKTTTPRNVHQPRRGPTEPHVPSASEIGKEVRDLRKKLDLTQGELSRLISVPSSTIAHVELGRRGRAYHVLTAVRELARQRGVQVGHDVPGEQADDDEDVLGLLDAQVWPRQGVQ